MNQKNVTAIIGQRIRRFRIQQNLSQEELAFSCELYPAHIGKIERGEKNPTLETLYKISVGLKVPLHRLLDISDETNHAEPDSYFRIQSALDGLNPEQAARIAQIVEEITSMMKESS